MKNREAFEFDAWQVLFACFVEQDLQKALEGTRLGMKHKDSEVEVSKLEKERLLGKLRADEGSSATSLFTAGH